MVPVQYSVANAVLPALLQTMGKKNEAYFHVANNTFFTWIAKL